MENNEGSIQNNVLTENKEVNSKNNVDPKKEENVKKSGNNKILLLILIPILLIICFAVCIGVSVLVIIPSLTNTAQNVINQELSKDENLNTLKDIITNDENFGFNIDRVIKQGNDVVLYVTVKNLTNSTQTFSTLLQVRMFSEKSVFYSQNFTSSLYTTEEQLDGEIPANGSKSGVIVFTVDDNPRNLQVEMKSDYFSESGNIYDITF